MVLIRSVNRPTYQCIVCLKPFDAGKSTAMYCSYKNDRGGREGTCMDDLAIVAKDAEINHLFHEAIVNQGNTCYMCHEPFQARGPMKASPVFNRPFDFVVVAGALSQIMVPKLLRVYAMCRQCRIGHYSAIARGTR